MHGRVLKRPQPVVVAHPTNPAELLEANDDEAERRERRKSKAPDQIPAQSRLPPSKRSKHAGSDDDEPPKQGAGKATSSSAGASSSSNQQKQLSKGNMSNRQLSELYNQVLKLNSENKINLKTTWNLPLIEHLNEIVLGDAGIEDPESQYETQNPSLSGAPNFTRASVTIDASMKIYATRVDSVYSTTLNLTGGIEQTDHDDSGNGAAEGGAGGAGAGGDAGGDADERQQKRRRERNERGVNTLEKNVANLNAKKFDLEFAVDPLFRKTSSAFEAGGPRGLLLNHLSVNNGREIIFDSTDAVREDEETEADHIAPAQGALDLGSLAGLLSDSLQGRNPETMDICPEYADFKFRSIDGDYANKGAERETLDLDVPDEDLPEDDAGMLDDMDVALPDVEFPEDDLKHQENRMMQELGAMAFPAAAAMIQVPEPHLDDDDDHHGGGMDLMQMEEVGEEEEGYRPPPPRSPRRQSLGAGQTVVDMFDVGAENPLLKDYSYFDMNKLNGWSGPQHWKYRHTVPKKTAEQDEEEKDGVLVAEAAGVDRAALKASKKPKKDTPKQKKAAFSIDFFNPMPEEEFNQLFEGGSRAATTLSKKQLAESERDAKALTLVSNVGYDVDKLVSLFLKPSMKITGRKRRSGPSRRSSHGGGAGAAHDGIDFGHSHDEGAFLGNGPDDDDDDMHDAPAIVRDDEDNPFDTEPAEPVDASGMPASQMGGFMDASQALIASQALAPAGAVAVELLPQPKKINEIKINYARQDKKIDVKKLKRAIWKDLCAPTDDSRAPRDAMEAPKDFQAVINMLPNDIPASTLRQVSVPYCFVCLLHLANEKHLNLTAEGLTTLFVKQTPEGSDVPTVDVGSVLFGGRRK